MGQEEPVAGGRRAVTALFADVAGSTELGRRHDPEDVMDVVGGAVRHFCEVVERFGGTVKDVAGDGILALFGAPYAHEDDPERAVLAGLEIQRVMEHHAETVARAAGVDGFGVRVGIETGTVVIAPIGGGSHRETGATGDAVNLAARLQTHAEIGTVLVGPETRRQLGDGFRWGPTRRLELRGLGEVVEASVAIGTTSGRRADLDVPLVGRVEEMRILTEVIDDLRQGNGRTVVVLGEAGIGKSRLLAEWRRYARRANVVWIQAGCSALDESTPFAGLLELLRAAAESTAVTGEARSILDALLDNDRGPDEVDQVPEAERFRTLAAVAAFATELASIGPVVLSLEDLHWSDPSTLDALRRLRDVARTSRVGVIVAMRDVPGHGSARLTGAEAETADIVLRLGPLTDDDERRLLHELSGGALPSESEDAVLTASEGVPLYLREFVRSVQEPDSVVTRQLSVPPTLERLIMARLDRLPADVRDVASALSVAGSIVDLEVAHAVVPGGDLDPALRELARQGLMVVGAGTCSFSHGLVQEVAYSTLLRGRRKELHRRVAESLEGMASDRRSVAALAHHWQLAGAPERALRYRISAADKAEAVSGLVEALGHVDAAVRLSAQVDVAADVGALVLRRATLHRRIGNVDAAREDAEQALETARMRRDRRLELAAVQELGSILAGAVDYRAATPLFDEALHLAEILGDPKDLVSCHARLSIAWTNRLRFDRGLEHGERALTIAREEGSPELEPAALDALKQVELQTGDFPAAVEHARAMLAFAESRGDLWSAQFCHLELGMISLAQGRWIDARSHLDDGLGMNRRVQDDGNTPAHLAVMAWLERLQGRYETGFELAKRAWDVALQQGHNEWIAWTAIYLGSLHLDLGAVDKASEVLARGASAAERSGADIHGVRCFARLGRARLMAGDPTGAREALGRADDIFLRVVLPPDRTFVFAWDAYVDAALIRATLGDASNATADLAALIGRWERDGLVVAVAEGRSAHCRLAFLAGDRDRAARIGEQTLEQATRAGLPGTAWRAHAFLSTIPRTDPGHAEAARRIVHGLTTPPGDHTLARELERELGEIR